MRRWHGDRNASSGGNKLRVMPRRACAAAACVAFMLAVSSCGGDGDVKRPTASSRTTPTNTTLAGATALRGSESPVLTVAPTAESYAFTTMGGWARCSYDAYFA